MRDKTPAYKLFPDIELIHIESGKPGKCLMDFPAHYKQ